MRYLCTNPDCGLFGQLVAGSRQTCPACDKRVLDERAMLKGGWSIQQVRASKRRVVTTPAPAPGQEEATGTMPPRDEKLRQDLTPEKLQELLQTSPIAAIAKMYGRSVKTIETLRREYKIPNPRHSGQHIVPQSAVQAPAETGQESNNDAAGAANASQRQLAAPGATNLPSPGNPFAEPVGDKPAPGSVQWQGIVEGYPHTPAYRDSKLAKDWIPHDTAPFPRARLRRVTTDQECEAQNQAGDGIVLPDAEAHALKPDITTFASQISPDGIDITLRDTNLSPADVRQYLRVIEGNLELAGDGLELILTIRGPRR